MTSTHQHDDDIHLCTFQTARVLCFTVCHTHQMWEATPTPSIHRTGSNAFVVTVGDCTAALVVGAAAADTERGWLPRETPHSPPHPASDPGPLSMTELTREPTLYPSDSPPPPLLCLTLHFSLDLFCN